MGFPYEVSRKAVNFFVTHANQLVDLCPRRLELIAKAFAVDHCHRVDAVKRAYTKERLDEARIDVSATADSVRIRTEYPDRNQSFSDGEPRRHNNPATVEYTLTIPRKARIDSADLVNGSLDIEGVEGDVKAACVNGQVKARGLTGDVKLSTVNGGVDATITRLVFGAGYVVAGLRLKQALLSGARWIQHLVLISGASLVVEIAWSFAMAGVRGGSAYQQGALAGGVLGIAIRLAIVGYLYASIRRLSTEARARTAGTTFE